MNICTLDTFCKCSLIERILSFTCYYRSPQYKLFTTLSRYKSRPQPTSITCFMYFGKKKIQLSNDIQKFINTSKYSYISIYGGHGLIMLCNMQMFLHSYNITTCNKYECIIATFNIKTWRTMYIIWVIKVIFVWLLYFSTH